MSSGFAIWPIWKYSLRSALVRSVWLSCNTRYGDSFPARTPRQMLKRQRLVAIVSEMGQLWREARVCGGCLGKTGRVQYSLGISHWRASVRAILLMDENEWSLRGYLKMICIFSVLFLYDSPMGGTRGCPL